MSTDSYLLASKAGELERLQLGSRMLEPPAGAYSPRSATVREPGSWT